MSLIFRYHLRQFRVRPWKTMTMLLSVALVVGIFCYLLALAQGLRKTLAVTADSHNLTVLAEGATAESNSALTHVDAASLTSIPGLAKNMDGRPLVSPEVVVQTNVHRRGAEISVQVGVAVRGVDLDMALGVHPTVKLATGRWFQPGADELVVGHTAFRRFAEGAVGSYLDCGDRRFQIVGQFEAGGGAYESEFWGHVSNVAAAYRRNMYSCAAIRLTSADPNELLMTTERIASAAVALRAVPEQAYYAEQGRHARIVEGMALVVLFFMGIGAVFAGMNLVHAVLSERLREIGMLRALGFSRRALMFGFVIESLTVALVGGLLGCAATAAFLAVDGGTRDLVATTTFTSVAFDMRLHAGQLIYAMMVAAGIGVLGTLWPAYRATCAPVIETLRTA